MILMNVNGRIMAQIDYPIFSVIGELDIIFYSYRHIIRDICRIKRKSNGTKMMSSLVDSVEKNQTIEAIFPSVSELYHAINSIKLTTEERDVGDLIFATDGLTVHWTNGSKSLQSGVFLGYKVGYWQ